MAPWWFQREMIIFSIYRFEIELLQRLIIDINNDFWKIIQIIIFQSKYITIPLKFLPSQTEIESCLLRNKNESDSKESICIIDYSIHQWH